MYRTIGICGNVSTGSSAYSDLLLEFEDAQVFDSREFGFTYSPDGLEDLEYHLKNYHKYMSYVVAISRFRKSIKISKSRELLPKKTIDRLTEEFLKKIIQVSWYGYGSVDKFIRPSGELFIKRILFGIAKITKIYGLRNLYAFLFPHKFEISKFPNEFDSAAKEYISNILDALGRKEGLATVLDQPFEGCNPVKSFKYFDNPKAIIVNRDPRDIYLFAKKFLRPRGNGYMIPCDTAENFIEYIKLSNLTPPDLHNRGDLLFINFEQLVYDYENTIKTVSLFTGLKKHTNKGKYFIPVQSRANTQVFKKYSGFKQDILKIEKELNEYLFDFDKYPDIEDEGVMFFGNQLNKNK